MSDAQPSFLLLVAGSAPRSHTAADCVRSACKEVYGEGCRVDVVDLSEVGESARRESVALTPTLIRQRPLPKRSWIGAFADAETLARALRAPDA